MTTNTPTAQDLHYAICGTIIHSLSPTQIEIFHDGLLVFSTTTGIITHLERNIHPKAVPDLLLSHNLVPSQTTLYFLPKHHFLIPGFIDTHHHAPQWAQRGTGRGKEILTWLNDVTFPHEAKFADPDYARDMYAKCVAGTIAQGTTTAVYYGSLHLNATKVLADTCLKHGLRALIGKCCMDREAPDWYVEESAERSLQETEEFIQYVKKIDPESTLVTAVITPRFAISCTPELLSGLGELAKKYPQLPIQTHFEETRQEVEYTKKLYPEFDNEADLWTYFGLLHRRTILGHCIYCSPATAGRIAAIGCGVTHCPISTVSVGDFGVAPIRDYLRRGIPVGLGTDSGGGYSSSILDALRYAGVVSTARERDTNGADPALRVEECFYLATLGGARVCSLDARIGNFTLGKEFDAIEVGIGSGTLAPVEEEDTDQDILEKFLWTGDDRNIARVWVRGKLIKEQ